MFLIDVKSVYKGDILARENESIYTNAEYVVNNIYWLKRQFESTYGKTVIYFSDEKINNYRTSIIPYIDRKSEAQVIKDNYALNTFREIYKIFKRNREHTLFVKNTQCTDIINFIKNERESNFNLIYSKAISVLFMIENDTYLYNNDEILNQDEIAVPNLRELTIKGCDSLGIYNIGAYIEPSDLFSNWCKEKQISDDIYYYYKNDVKTIELFFEEMKEKGAKRVTAYKAKTKLVNEFLTGDELVLFKKYPILQKRYQENEAFLNFDNVPAQILQKIAISL